MHPYRDALTAEPQPSRLTQKITTLCPDDTGANTAVKERQILLDFDPNHLTLNKNTPHREVVNMVQRALTNLQDQSGPTLQARALIHLQNGGYVIELTSAKAAAWVRDPIRKQILTQSLGGNACIKDRLYNLLVPFVPITGNINNEHMLRDIEKTNDIPANSITQMHWIKDPQKRGRNQCVAHTQMSLNSPKAANKLIRDSMYFDFGILRPYKDKKEPLCCLKCQHWGHMAKNCTKTKDTCGTCASEHCHSKCNSYCTYYCMNCRSPSHSSSDKECPEYKTQLEALNARTPENSMLYFPTEELWTQVSLPPKPTGPIIHSQPPVEGTPQQCPAVIQQRTIDWMLQRQTDRPQHSTSAPIVNGRMLVPLGSSKPNRTPTTPSPKHQTSPSSSSSPPTNLDKPPEPPTTAETNLQTHPDPFPMPSTLHFPGTPPSTPHHRE